jgi:hypothetical protein
MKKWYKLDAFAKTYSSIISEGRTTCFRLSAVLKEDVDKSILIKAADNLLEKYDFFNVELKKGVFWNYLQQKNQKFSVSREVTYPCTYVKKNTPLRILCYRKKISVEIAHFLSDGMGTIDFLRSLLKEYLILKYNLIKNDDDKKPGYENLYEKHMKKVSKEVTIKKAFHFPYKVLEKGYYFVTTGEMGLDEIKSIAKKYNTTTGKFLLSVYFKVIMDTFKVSKESIVIGVPVDLRKIFDGETNRNFFINITPSIDPTLGDYTLEEIIKYVNTYFEMKINRKEFYKSIYKAMKPSRNKLIGVVPYIVKRLFLPFIFDYYGERGYTSGFSNLGDFKIENEFVKYIEKIEFIPPPSKRCKAKIGMIGFNGRVYLTFGNLSSNNELEKNYFRYLRKLGVRSKIISNY